MSVSEKVKGMLALTGKKQIELAEEFEMSKQTMSNKMARNSWSASDLARAARFCGCSLAIILPDGQRLIIESEAKNQAK